MYSSGRLYPKVCRVCVCVHASSHMCNLSILFFKSKVRLHCCESQIHVDFRQISLKTVHHLFFVQLD